MLPIDQLTQPLTQEQVKASIYNLMKATGLPVTSWQEGAVARTIIAIIAAVFAGFTEVMATAIRAGFLDLAEGIWLTLLAKYVYGVDRIEATFATGEVTLNNNGGGVFSFDPGDLIVRNPATNKLYTNTAAFDLGALEKGKKVPIRAAEVGAASTAAPGQITEFVTTLLLVTVTNEASVVGLNAELDPALRQRCRDSLGALSPNGPRSAYEFWAKSARRPDGSSVGITRVRILRPIGDGTVTVIVASATGPVPGDANDPSTDLGIVNDVIQKFVVPDGVTATVVSAVARPIPVTCDVWIYTSSGMGPSNVDVAVRQKLAAYFQVIPIGGFIIPPAAGKVSWRAIEGQIESISSDVIEAKLTPEVDTGLAGNEVAVLGQVIVNVHMVVAAAAA
jgi:hypothetical protein